MFDVRAGIMLNICMTKETRKRNNTTLVDIPVPTFHESDPVIKDLTDKWAGLTDREIKELCDND